MTTFDERERAFEARFAHDADLAFKVTVRRNRLLGHWAGALLGHEGEALDRYVQSVVSAELGKDGDDDVARKVAADLAPLGLDITPALVREKMAEFMTEVRAQAAAEG